MNILKKMKIRLLHEVCGEDVDSERLDPEPRP